MVNYKNIDWKKSPAYIHFLSRFRNPRSRKRETQTTYIAQNLKEDIDHAIQRFVDGGILIKPTLAEAINSLHNRPPIEEMLRKNDLKASGNKPQLIERLIEYAPEAAQSMVGEHDLLICSAEALAFLETHEEERKVAEKAAKEQAFSALLNGDGKQAYKIHIEYQRVYGNPETYGGGNYYAQEMEIVLKNEPELLRHLNEPDKKYLRAATCMPMLWREESSLKWLPEDFSTRYEDGEVAATLLAKYAQIQHRVGDADKNDKFEISFDPYDVDSCELCRRFDGKVLALSEIPELPDVNCSSKKGCQCDIRHHWESRYASWDEDEDFDEENDEGSSGLRTGISIDFGKLLDLESLEEFISEKVEEYVKENIEIRLDPLSKLQVAKRMLDEGLITSDEYEATKQHILSKF